MGKVKRADSLRHASATPQRPNPLLRNIIDLTENDPWARQGHTSAPVPRPTPLSPSFGGPHTITTPRDPKSNPAYIFQQLALSRNRASIRPNFVGVVSPDDGTVKDDDEARDETPTPSQKDVNERREKKKKKHSKNARENKSQKAAIVKEESSKHREEKKQRKEKKLEKKPNYTATEAQSQKRKHEDDEAEDFKRRVEVEANAVKKLRESLPTIRISRVTRKLERETGIKPTEMAVLLTAAKETIIDLARQQVMQTEKSYQTIQTELVRLMKEQNDRLEKLQGQRIAPVQAENESSEDGDSDEEEDGTPHKSRSTESVTSSSDVGDKNPPGRDPEYVNKRCQGQVQ